MTQPSALKVDSLRKAFTHVKAVDNISFSVERGDVFAFLGPNGAGKTTTLRILLDIIKADSGTVRWCLNGRDHQYPAPEHIGYLPEERGLYLDIPIIKSLVYLATIRGMDKAQARKSALEWLERLGLADRANEKLQVLSKGNQQKVQFVASILHKPLFAIIDEPFSGLDPLNQELFIGYIREINRQGTTMIISAHQMSLIEKIANKVLLINKGQHLFCGSLSELYNIYGNKRIFGLQFDSPVNKASLESLPGLEHVRYKDDFSAELTFSHSANMKGVLSQLTTIEGICDISSHKPDLHDIFLQLVKTN